MVGGNSLLNIWLSILTNFVFDMDDRPSGTTLSLTTGSMDHKNIF